MSAAVDQVTMSRAEFERRLESEYQTGFRHGRAEERREEGLARSLTHGPISLSPAIGVCTVNGTLARLSPTQIRILEMLMRSPPGVPIHLNTFVERLYPEDSEVSDPKNVTLVMIHRLRRALADAGAPEAVGNVWGYGYMLVKPDV